MAIQYDTFDFIDFNLLPTLSDNLNEIIAIIAEYKHKSNSNIKTMDSLKQFASSIKEIHDFKRNRKLRLVSTYECIGTFFEWLNSNSNFVTNAAVDKLVSEEHKLVQDWFDKFMRNTKELRRNLEEKLFQVTSSILAEQKNEIQFFVSEASSSKKSTFKSKEIPKKLCGKIDELVQTMKRLATDEYLKEFFKANEYLTELDYSVIAVTKNLLLNSEVNNKCL